MADLYPVLSLLCNTRYEFRQLAAIPKLTLVDKVHLILIVGFVTTVLVIILKRMAND